MRRSLHLLSNDRHEIACLTHALVGNCLPGAESSDTLAAAFVVGGFGALTTKDAYAATFTVLRASIGAWQAVFDRFGTLLTTEGADRAFFDSLLISSFGTVMTWWALVATFTIYITFSLVVLRVFLICLENTDKSRLTLSADINVEVVTFSAVFFAQATDRGAS